MQLFLFDNIIKVENLDIDHTLLDEESYKNFLTYDISYKTLIHAKPLRIRFNKVDEFIRVYDGNRDLALSGPDKHSHLKEDYVIS